MAKGTMIRPPRDRAAELMLMAVARRRLNHRESNAAVLERAGPLWAIDAINPNMNTRNRMWKVRERRTVDTPSTINPVSITLRPPVRSNSWPTNGCKMPPDKTPMLAAIETLNRLQPNSSLIGITNTPKLLRAPLATNPMNKVAATTYHPKYMGFLVVAVFCIKFWTRANALLHKHRYEYYG